MYEYYYDKKVRMLAERDEIEESIERLSPRTLQGARHGMFDSVDAIDWDLRNLTTELMCLGKFMKFTSFQRLRSLSDRRHEIRHFQKSLMTFTHVHHGTGVNQGIEIRMIHLDS